MAARKTPSAGGKPDKLFRDALMLEVKRLGKDEDGKSSTNINLIAAKVVKKAKDGSEAAFQLIRDTLDGRPAQQVALTGANDGPVEITWSGKP